MSKPELINDLRALCTNMLDVACKLDSCGGSDSLAKGYAVCGRRDETAVIQPE